MESLVIEKDGKFVFSSHKHSREEIVKEKAKYYWELIRGGYKQKFKVGDRVILDKYPCIVNKVEWRGDSKYVGYVYTVIGTDFGRKVKEEDLMLDPSKEETKSHNNMCKQLIDEMNPNVEINVKTKPEPKFKVGDKIKHKCDKNNTVITITGSKDDYYYIQYYNNKKNEYQNEAILFTDQDKYEMIEGLVEEETKPKPSNTVSVDKAAEVFADMLIELCPELLGFGGAAKEWENEFRKRLEE